MDVFICDLGLCGEVLLATWFDPLHCIQMLVVIVAVVVVVVGLRWLPSIVFRRCCLEQLLVK